MIPLVFLQVLEPFCPLFEQESSEPEDVEVNHHASSTTMLITSQTELNSHPLPSDSSAPTHNDQSSVTSLTETEAVSVPLTVVASPSLSDTGSDLPPPTPPLSDSTSSSQPSSVSVPTLSNSPSDPQPAALSVHDDSPPQTQSDPPNSHSCVDVIAAPLSEIVSDESDSTQIENPSLEIVTSHSSIKEVPNSPSYSLA